jgi:hypothetical protein
MFTGTVYFKIYETKVNRRIVPGVCLHNNLLNNKNKTNRILHIKLLSIQNLLSSRLLSKNIKIRIYKTIILSVVLYGYETWFLDIKVGT